MLAIFFAAYLADKRELIATSVWKVGPLRLPDPKHLGPVIIAWAVTLIVMVYQKDLGSSLLFFALFVVMIWVATGRTSFLVIGGGLFAAGAWFAWRSFGHVQERVSIWLDPWKDPSGRATSSSRACSPWPSAASPAPGSASAATCASPPARTTSSSPSSPRSSACSAGRW